MRSAEQARDRVGRPAGRIRDDDRDGPAGIGLRMRNARNRRRGKRACGKLQDLAAGERHGCPRSWGGVLTEHPPMIRSSAAAVARQAPTRCRRSVNACADSAARVGSNATVALPLAGGRRAPLARHTVQSLSAIFNSSRARNAVVCKMQHRCTGSGKSSNIRASLRTGRPGTKLAKVGQREKKCSSGVRRNGGRLATSIGQQYRDDQFGKNADGGNFCG